MKSIMREGDAVRGQDPRIAIASRRIFALPRRYWGFDVSPPKYWGFDVSPPRFWGFDASPPENAVTTDHTLGLTIITLFFSAGLTTGLKKVLSIYQSLFRNISSTMQDCLRPYFSVGGGLTKYIYHASWRGAATMQTTKRFEVVHPVYQEKGW